MGFVSDTQMSQFIPPAMIQKSAGTWTPTLAGNVISDVRTANDSAFNLFIPVVLPSHEVNNTGVRLKSIDVFYKVATAACDAVTTVELEKFTLPATAVAPTGAAVTCTIDAGHDTDAERLAVGDHTMTVTITTPEWLRNSSAYGLYITVDAAAGTVFTLYGARINYDFRI